MKTKILAGVGGGLFAGCGMQIAAHFGLTGSQSLVFIGFASSVILLVQLPAFTLRARVAQLEAKSVAQSSNAA
jgi:hypothetical protein